MKSNVHAHACTRKQTAGQAEMLTRPICVTHADTCMTGYAFEHTLRCIY